MRTNKSGIPYPSEKKEYKAKQHHVWYEKNKLNRKKYNRKYYLNHEEIIKEQTKRYYRIRTGTFNKKRKGFCECCGLKCSTSIHHIIPKWFRVDNDMDNLIEVCRKHHMKLEHYFERFIIRGDKFNKEVTC